MSFRLEDYEPVEVRIEKFWNDHKNGRLRTSLVDFSADNYIVLAEAFREATDVEPAATGYAQEQRTDKGVNSTSALENCETSAIGRALANLGYAAKGKRPSREEMTKAQPPDPRTALFGEIKAAGRAKNLTDEEIAADFTEWTQGAVIRDADADSLTRYYHHLNEPVTP